MQPKDKNDGIQLSTRYEQYMFAKRHLRGTRRPEVFPIVQDSRSPEKREDGGQDTSRHQDIQKPDRQDIQTSGDIPNFERFTGWEAHTIRRLTPTECERLQGFPDGWTEGVSDTQRYKCLGNAVTVNVVQAVMEPLLCEGIIPRHLIFNIPPKGMLASQGI